MSTSKSDHIHDIERFTRRLIKQYVASWALVRRRPQPGQGARPLATFARYNRAYFRRWLVIGVLIGIVAGFGAILFYSAIALASQVLLGGIAGFTQPHPASEGISTITPVARPWLLPLITTLGGLLTGIIVFKWAPEAEGHGTDAAIEAFHEKGGRIRARIPFVKLIASAITIGSGGSAGREGPTAQISAGFGSWLADLLHLDEHDRRIAMAAGIGAGIGSIFKAPFGGALLSAEILYKRDFEADALFPSFIASVVGFSIYGAWAGWTPVFGIGGHFTFDDPANLLGYLILGICAGLVGLLYPKTLYTIRDGFARLHLPNWLKPAIGGLGVGIIGLLFPQALGMGYGYVQFGINNDFLHMAAWLMAILVFVKILTTSLTIGSGGSGGVFGPGMVIGGFLGGSLWAGLHAIAPAWLAGAEPGAFVVVGMGAFFGGIAKAPLAVILMVAEMTGEYSLIVPAMLATMVAYLVTGDVSIYEKQVPTRLDSPAHKDDYALPLLQNLEVQDAMLTESSGLFATVTPEASLSAVEQLFRDRRVASVIVVQDGKLVGVVTANDLTRLSPADLESDVAKVRQVMSRAVVRAYPDETLYAVWLRMSRRGLRQLPVVERSNASRLLGIVTVEAIAQVLSSSKRGRTALSRTKAASRDMQGDVANETRTSTLATPAESGAGIPLAAHGDPLAHTPVADAMQRNPVTVLEATPLQKLRRTLEPRNAVLVVNEEGLLLGIVTRSDISDEASDRARTAGDIAVRNLVTARPGETLRAAVRRMSRLGLRQLPVVEGELPAKPVGLLRRRDVLSAYSTSTTKRTPVNMTEDAPPQASSVRG